MNQIAKIVVQQQVNQWWYILFWTNTIPKFANDKLTGVSGDEYKA